MIKNRSGEAIPVKKVGFCLTEICLGLIRSGPAKSYIFSETFSDFALSFQRHGWNLSQPLPGPIFYRFFAKTIPIKHVVLSALLLWN